ncbi:unnamed protein product [Polarella glacialis]|uniref:OmpA-like domain-containing protein n=1 Tax=Polarella glacialis TaxID=89957 RepID=A0A813IM19_POLGL|nr:unnamed protein product [Polarella glacialis]
MDRGVLHPLLAFPALAALVARSVVDTAEELGGIGEGGTSVEATGEEFPPSPSISRRSVSKTSAASRNAAKLLEALPTPSGDEAASPRTPASKWGRVQKPLSIRGSLSGASALLGDGERLTVEAVTFASQAVGALFKWVLAQRRYAKAAEDAGQASEQAAATSSKEAEDCQQRVAEAASALDEERRKWEADAAELDAAGIAANEAEQKAESAEQVVHQLSSAAAIPEARAEEAPQAEENLFEALRSRSVAVPEVEVEIRERVTFSAGSALMSSFVTHALHGVVGVMRRHGDLIICVEGHCRPDEADSLSSERANRVLEELVKQGVPRHRLRAAGFGSSFSEEPEVENLGRSGAARVEFGVIQEISIKGTVQFGPCSDRLAGASEPLLQGVAALLLARPCLRVRVEGHTDNSPFFGGNLELAEGRAQSVVAALGRAGVAEERLVPVGFGEKLPRVSNATSEGKAKNRRVEFHILHRETVRGLQQLLGGREQGPARPRPFGMVDAAAVRQLVRTATGEGGVALASPIRRAAADVLRRLGADWQTQRLLHLASRREDPTRCPLARLPEDCVRRILQLYFLLGCFSPP